MTRERIVDLVRGAPSGALDEVAPATPKWRVRDVLAHVVGVADDSLAQRLEGVTTEPWTDAQVAARAERSVDDVLAEWDTLAPQFEAGITQLPPVLAGQILFDAFTHEHDMRHALGEVGARDGEATDLVFDWMVHVRALSGRPALRFDTGNGTTVGGTGNVVATVGASRFELARAATGRRSASEVGAYSWDRPTDASTILIAPIFTIRDTPLGE
jgi:uncharacterized protein (TIGR03083 family)